MAENDSLDPEDNPKPKIKVTDRRKFDSEGNLRQDAEEAAAEAASPAAEPEKIGDAGDDRQADADPEPGPRPVAEEPDVPIVTPEGTSEPSTTTSAPAGDAAGATDEKAPPRGGPTEATAASGSPGEEAAAGERPSPGDLPRDFSAFVESQYFEALLYLGAMRHPQTGEVVEDLEMAKYKIDILTMLQEKTDGNLDSEESKLIEDVVYQLRMAYLQKQKVAKL